MKLLPSRFRQLTIAVAVSAAVAMTGSAVAKAGNPNAISGKSAYVLSVPDLPAFWTAWKANAIYGAFKEAMESPEFKPKMETFNAQLKTIEAALGYPLNGDSISQIFKSVDGYVVPGEQAGEVASGFIFTVSDKAKLEKLIDLIEKAAVSAAASAAEEDEETTETETTTTTDKPSGGADGTEKAPAIGGAEDDETTAPNPITTEQYKGVTIKRFSGSDDQEVYYAIVDSFFVGSNDRAEIKAIVDRLKGGSAADSLAGSEAYKKIEAGLASRPGEAYIFTNTKGAMEVGSQPNLQFIQDFVKRFAPVDNTGSSIKVSAKNISAYSFAPLSTDAASAQGREWILKNPGDKPLEIVNFVPAETLMVGATSLIDADAISELVGGLMQMTAGASSDMEKQLKQTEAALGFSVKEDLVPAVGNEVAFLLNSVTFGSGPIPGVDAALILKIKDKAKMTKVLSGVEKLVSALGASQSSGTDSKGGVKTEKVGEATIKYVELPFPGVTPGYAISGDYLLIATTKESIKNMIEIKGGKGQGLLASELYKKLQPQVSTTANGFNLVNFKSVWSTAAGVAKAIPAAAGLLPVVDALDVLSVYGKSSVVKDGAIIAESILLLE